LRQAKYDVLFEPIQIGPKVSRNRFYQTPHCMGAGSERPRFQAHFRAMKAEGGWGVVSTEYCSISPESDDVPRVSARLWDDEDASNLALMCQLAHQHGALTAVELWHGGAIAPRLESRTVGRGASPMASPWTFMTSCKEMDAADIAELRRLYVTAAVRASDAGFDLITFHMCHVGSVLAHFLHPFFNRRADRYGGSFENRSRLALDVIGAVREAVGSQCGIIVRFSVDTLDRPQGYGSRGVRADQDGFRFLEAADTLVDLWDLNASGLESGEDVGPSRFHPQNHQRPFLLGARDHTDKPIVNVGRFTDPDEMLAAVTSGQCDLIGGARPSIADPFLPKKIEDGRLDEIRECIGCNMCYSRWEIGGPPIICTQNATAGEEYRRGWHPEQFRPANNREGNDVLVIGAGPAGMECAIVLGKRGMRRVHLVEAEDDMGGAVRWIPRLPGLGEWGRVVDYRRIQIEKLRNVQFIPNRGLDAQGVMEYGAEIVVVATGSSWATDGMNGFTMEPIDGANADLPNMLTPEQIMVAGKPVPLGKVLVYDCDGYFMGVSLAEQLARDGRDVVLVTPFETVAPYMRYTLEWPRMTRLIRSLRVDARVESTITRIREGHARIADITTAADREGLEFDALVLVTQREAQNSLYRELTVLKDTLQDEGVQAVYQIGDCVAPQFIADAVFSGHRLAREIDSDDPSQPQPFLRERPLV